jgi:glycosyltransferase involved in cell wall biosynthesis
VVLTLNEEVTIERCLASLSWADEIVVLDSGSEDRTVSLAKAAGARVVQHRQDGPFQIA